MSSSRFSPLKSGGGTSCICRKIRTRTASCPHHPSCASTLSTLCTDVRWVSCESNGSPTHARNSLPRCGGGGRPRDRSHDVPTSPRSSETPTHLTARLFALGRPQPLCVCHFLSFRVLIRILSGSLALSRCHFPITPCVVVHVVPWRPSFGRI